MTNNENQQATVNISAELRASTAAVRIRHRKLGVRKALTPAQRTSAADVFQADSSSLSASKRLLDTKNDAYKAVMSVRREATEYWRRNTVVYPEPGLRLIKREKIASFDAEMKKFQGNLAEAVEALELCYNGMRLAAKDNLGSLYDAKDYPDTLEGEFELAWEYPSVEPPNYLKEIQPALYAAEQARIAARFDEAVRLTEQAMTEELSQLVGHLCDQLTGDNDGKPKVIRESALANIQEFFTRFSEVGIRSNAELDALAAQAKDLVAGIDAKGLRSNASARADMAAKMAEVRVKVDSMVVVRKRAISFEEDEPAAAGEEHEFTLTA